MLATSLPALAGEKTSPLDFFTGAVSCIARRPCREKFEERKNPALMPEDCLGGL